MRQAFRESEERHWTLFENMKQGVVYHDAIDGSTITANASALRILGLTEDQMMGKTPMDPQWQFLSEDESPLPVAEYPAVVALQGIPVTNMILGVYRNNESEITWARLDAMPRFRPGEDKPYQAYTIFSDITEIKQAEQNLRRAKEAAEEADQLKSAFLATMSHEIRTPLNGIMGSLDLVLSNNLDPRSRTDDLESLQVAMDSGQLLLSIIEDILDLSKIEAGQLEIVHRPFFLQALTDASMKLAKAYQIQCKKKLLEVRCSLHDSICEDLRIYGDQLRLQQVLNNLLSNAIKFTEKGTVSLTIEHCSNSGALQFCVHDTGKGIPDDRLDIIFEPFRQVDFGDTRKYGGTGLGLTISKKLVRLMGGTLWVESTTREDCAGSRFFFTVPFQPAPPLTNTLVPAPLLSVPSQLSTILRSPKVSLLAEDDRVSRRVVTRMLQKAGFEVLEAHDGVEALSMYELHRHRIDLIVMDVMMPNMDGLEAVERIRASECKTNSPNRVPIVALSAGAMKGDREVAIEKGMTSYLTKPISYEVLVATLNKCFL